MDRTAINDIVNRAPKIDEIILDEIKNDFKKYIFFFDSKDKKERTCICSHCSSEYVIDEMSGLNRENPTDKHSLLMGNHNDKVKCHLCGHTAQLKSIEKSKRCIELTERHNYAYFIPGENPENEAWIISFIARKDYENKKKDNLEIILESIYQITPKYAIQLRQEYSWRTDCLFEWFNVEKFTEPFYIGQMAGYAKYYKRGFEKCKDTFLRYSGYDLWGLTYICKYLAMYPTHKAYEMLLKSGLDFLVIESVFKNHENKKIINWLETDYKKILNLTKEEVRDVRKIIRSFPGCNITHIVQTYLKAKKKFSKVTLFEIANIENEVGGYRSNNTFNLLFKANVSPKRFLNYLDKIFKDACHSTYCACNMPSKNMVFNMYFDYLAMARQINYDLSQEVVLMPKDMVKAHDVANEVLTNIETEREESRNSSLNKQAEKLMKKRMKQYAFENAIFAIVVPKNVKEIVAEGQILKHCVGSYVERHAKGKITILFLRDKENINMPLYTIEMQDKKMIQVQGYANNTHLTPDAEAFFDAWLEWVEAGSPRNKDGTPKELKKTDAA